MAYLLWTYLPRSPSLCVHVIHIPVVVHTGQRQRAAPGHVRHCRLSYLSYISHHLPTILSCVELEFSVRTTTATEPRQKPARCHSKQMAPIPLGSWCNTRF